MENIDLTLGTMAGGALEKQFADAVAGILDNVNDPQTAATKNREIMIKITLTPSADRCYLDISASVVTKKVSAEAVQTTARLGFSATGKVTAHERYGEQGDLYAESPPRAATGH